VTAAGDGGGSDIEMAVGDYCNIEEKGGLFLLG
jgi:hypothetical protein